MAVRSGFFNSVNGDRKYDARRFAEYFASFIGNGVFPNPSTNLQVVAQTTPDMTVIVRPGKAWINGYILINDDDYILQLDPADGALNRIDRVVVRYDTIDREIRLEIKKGQFGSQPVAPALQRDADAYELALADIYVAAGAVSITQANITDLRLNTELCGIVHGTVEQVDTTTLFNQYLTWLQEKKNQYDQDMLAWTEQKKNEFEDWAEAQEQDFEAWRSQEEQNFYAWLEYLQDILDENVAGNLLDLIESHKTDRNNPHNVTPEQIGAETPAGAQAKADAAEARAKAYTDQEVAEVSQALDAHKAEKATQDTLGHIRLQDIPVKSVNGKTGEVVIDVGDIAGLVSSILALGQGASAAGNYSVALGNNASAGYSSVALGRDASAAEDSSVALGQGASAAGHYSVALGRDASATKYHSVALGRSASAAGTYSVALGRAASAAGTSSVALGYDASAENDYEGILGSTGSTSKWKVPGDFTVSGTKNFEIPHPKPEKKATHVIRHGAVESPTPGDTLYRWKVQATKDNDLVTIDLPDYFVWLNKDVQIWVTPQGHFGNGYGELNRETEQLEIHCQYAGEYNVLVIGTRNDDHPSVQEWYIKGVEREIGESWTGETYVFSVDEIIEIEEIKEVEVA